MTRFGLTTGFGDPLGGLLDDLADRQVDVARQSLRPDSDVSACVQDFAGRRIRPHFVIPRLVDVHAQMRTVLKEIVARLGSDGADVAAGNESSINGETVDEALAAVHHTLEVAEQVGFTGRVFATSIPNLDPGRDFDWMRELWPRLPAGVVRDVHRYPEIRLPWHLDDDHPWHQFDTLDREIEVVLAMAAGEPVSLSEVSYSTVRRRVLWMTRQVMPSQSRDYLVDTLVRCARYGLTDAMVYQINSGRDPDAWGECQGIRDADGNWLPQADCFRLARARLTT